MESHEGTIDYQFVEARTKLNEYIGVESPSFRRAVSAGDFSPEMIEVLFAHQDKLSGKEKDHLHAIQSMAVNREELKEKPVISKESRQRLEKVEDEIELAVLARDAQLPSIFDVLYLNSFLESENIVLTPRAHELLEEMTYFFFLLKAEVHGISSYYNDVGRQAFWPPYTEGVEELRTLVVSEPRLSSLVEDTFKVVGDSDAKTEVKKFFSSFFSPPSQKPSFSHLKVNTPYPSLGDESDTGLFQW